MKRWGFDNVDDTNAMSASMVTEVYGKCHLLLVRLNPEGVTSSWWKKGHCHGGFLRKEAKGYSPTVQLYSVCPITAKHNLRTVSHKTKGVFKPTAASFTVEDNGVGVDWSDLAWEPNASDMLDLRAGMEARPAIAEFGFGPTQQTIMGNKNVKLPDFKQDDIERFFALPDRLNIYTGEILYVGQNFIESDINSFTVCSGAIVFLLDKNQPSSVDEADYGKAVAIHSAAHPVLTNQNYGFLINEHPVFKGL
ncbi:hypothetical protein SEMRO_3743_G350790.1 [Seminavis robusta]|uniref:Uncharacterized protein n=1 Tax=Seminavis robusta TaxID=568900 RepID=A0A9N8F5Z1_9STRA|nr:hypothetical protein SEMRO_3743_G350790.1 [Seminavis robusta]|eukprot:Sro3743_g350790.1 n/a (250) ;mRNA; f:3496-4385